MVDLAENSIVEDNDTTQLHTMENGASTSPYARANLQLPPKRKERERECDVLFYLNTRYEQEENIGIF